MKEADRRTTPIPGFVLHDVGYEQALAQLPPSIRWVTMLAVVEGLSPDEIAELAGVSSDDVLNVLDRGRSIVEDFYKKSDSDNNGRAYENN